MRPVMLTGYSSLKQPADIMPVEISVVIPMYNAASWINETLASVVRQTYPRDNIEVILVDDASRDDSVEVARTFLRDHSLTGHVIAREQNAGASAARNVGWRDARGQWIQFLDADDLLAPHKLERQAATAAQVPDDVVVVYSNWQNLELIDGQWRPTGAVSDLWVDDDARAARVAGILQEFSFGYGGPTLIRKAFLAVVGGFDEDLNLGEDIDLMLRVAMTGGRFQRAESREPVFFYRQTPGSLWRQSGAQMQSVRNMARVFRQAEAFLREQDAHGLPVAARGSLARRYARCLEFFAGRDPDSYQQMFQWIGGLGLTACPPYVSRGMQLASRLVGYENALRFRLSYWRQARAWLGR
jgi:glycosyltransferase involved in cell wall biosynthesis